MLKACDGCKDGLDTDKDGSSVSTDSTNGAALTPFRANGAHPSHMTNFVQCIHSH